MSVNTPFISLRDRKYTAWQIKRFDFVALISISVKAIVYFPTNNNYQEGV